ncbi:MAG: hypothetical protein WC774_04365, partial [Candidatus Gracilibacteria bacterium]
TEAPLGYDTTGKYEYTSLGIFSGPNSDAYPKIAIHQSNTLAILREDLDGEIQFGKDLYFTSLLEIPLEDVFGILLLLYKFSGRSGATNREILRVFIEEYTDSEEF